MPGTCVFYSHLFLLDSAADHPTTPPSFLREPPPLRSAGGTASHAPIPFLCAVSPSPQPPPISLQFDHTFSQHRFSSAPCVGGLTQCCTVRVVPLTPVWTGVKSDGCPRVYDSPELGTVPFQSACSSNDHPDSWAESSRNCSNDHPDPWTKSGNGSCYSTGHPSSQAKPGSRSTSNPTGHPGSRAEPGSHSCWSTGYPSSCAELGSGSAVSSTGHHPGS